MLGTERRHTPPLYDGEKIHGGERARPMGYHDGNPFTFADLLDGARQGCFTFGVEVRVWLVHHDNEGIAVQRAGQANALALSGRECSPLRSELCLIALREAHDHLMDACGFGGLYDLPRITLFCQARDVLFDRSVEQGHFLGQIADVAAEGFLIPLG